MKNMRVVAIDNLRLISILGVILIHTTTRNLELVNLDITLLPTIFFFNQVSRFAVPLFFLIAGFNLELDNSLRKRLRKILLPYIFWSLVYYFFVFTRHSTNFFSALLSGNSSYQLYFIPSLIILYFLFPLFHRLVSKPLITSTLFIIQLYLLYTDYFVKPLSFFYPLNIALLNYFVFTLGTLVARHQKQLLVSASRFKYLLLIITIALGVYVFYEGKTQYLSTHNYLAYYSSWRISIFFYTLGIFSIFFSLMSKIILPLSQLSFSVFFVHVLILEILTPFFGYSGLWLFITVTFFSFLSSHLIRSLITRNPQYLVQRVPPP